MFSKLYVGQLNFLYQFVVVLNSYSKLKNEKLYLTLIFQDMEENICRFSAKNTTVLVLNYETKMIYLEKLKKFQNLLRIILLQFNSSFFPEW